MEHFEIDVSEFDPFSTAVLTAALAHARRHRETKTHALLLEDFYRLAGLGGEMCIVNFMGAVCEAMKSTVCSPDYEGETLRCWPVFDSIIVTRTKFEFAVNPRALDAAEFPLRPDQVREMLGLSPKVAVNHNRGRPLPKATQKLPAWFCADTTDLITLDILKR